jgi:hypothetical protein
VNSKEVLDYLKHPEKLQKPQSEQLERVLEEYPYSGVLHALYLKALKNQNNYLYPKQLKRTAIAVPDRKALYYWVEVEAELVEKPKLKFYPEAIPTPAAEMPPVAPIVVTPEPPKPVVQPLQPPVAPMPIVAPAPLKIEQPAPVHVAAVSAPVIAEGDLELANLPASVRETVLRARRIRQQLGNAFNDAPPGEKPTEPMVAPVAAQPFVEPSAPVPIPIPLPETPVEPVIAEKPVVDPEPIAEPEIISEPAPTTAPEPVFEASLASEKIQPKPEPQKEETPILIIQQPAAPRVRHSFLDWLEAEETEEIPEEFTVIAHLEEVEEIVPEVQEEPALQGEEASAEPNLSAPKLHPAEQKEPTPSTEEVKNLYDAFMEKRPKPRLDFKATDAAINTASLSTSDYAAYITETLAQVYVKQKLYDRAINAYEILGLKYPEKSGLFAARISEIKRLIND